MIRFIKGGCIVSIRVGRYRAIEVCLGLQYQRCWFRFEVRADRKVDHAGLYLDFGVLGLGLQAAFYDTRHWNYEADRWFHEGEENEGPRGPRRDETR
jgi:hypothetical protein